MTRLAALRRNIAFARHVPLRQWIARGKLRLQRRRSLKSPPLLHGIVAGELALAPTAPAPIFPPRTGRVARHADGWRFTFLNRKCALAETVDWTAPGPGVANQLWRMNLHYMEYLEELPEAQALDLIRQWIAANPPFQPGYWDDSWNSYTLSIRVTVWMQQIAQWDWDRSDPQYAAVFQSLAQQITFLEGNLEQDIGGNHLIKNIKALAYASAFFTGPRADRWRALAVALLREQLPLQILADGMHYERSPSYHAQVFADLIECSQVLGDAGPADLAPTLDRMARATAVLAHPDGTPALFNDAGLTMAYSPAQCLAAYTACTGIKLPVPQGGFALPSAGYFGLHTPLLSLILDLGRIAPDALPAHGHGDMGSFELSVGGLRMIVDQGVYTYVPGDLRDQSRSAHYHNVLAANDAEPAEFFGAFRCGRRPQIWLEEVEVHPDSIVAMGRHNGYAQLPGRPMFSRRFTATGDQIRLSDHIHSQNQGATWRLLLHPDCAVTLMPDGAQVTRGPAQLRIKSPKPLSLTPALWWPDMGHEIPTQRLTMDLDHGVTALEVLLDVALHTGTGAS